MSDVKTTLTWLLRDQVSGTAKQINGNLDKLGLKTKNTGTNFLGLAAMVGTTVGVLGDFVKAAADEQINVAKLGASLQANIPAWDGNTKAIEDTIAMREKLAFSDDDLRGSLALLVASTHDVDKAFAIQQTAMDLARFKGISLQDATVALTKVEGGQYRALASLGIVLQKGTDQTAALAAVQKVAGGQADAYANTIIGKTERIGIAFNDAKENVGSFVIDSVDALARLGQSLVQTTGYANHTQQEVGKIVVNTNALSLEARDAKKPIDALGTSIDGMTGSVSGLADESANDIATFAATLGIFAKYQHIADLSSGKGITLPGGKHPQAKASGGWVGKSGPEHVLVGERGPEYISPSTPNGQSGGGGFTIQGVSAAQIVDMVDRGLYFKLNRASKNAVRP